MTFDDSGEVRTRPARALDWWALTRLDTLALAGDTTRRASIRKWCEGGCLTVADGPRGPVGYGVLEYNFFEQGFITMLMVAPDSRRCGVGTRLLHTLETTCTSPKLFTSTNVSNHQMQCLLQSNGWRPVGLLHGLDEGDPELFYLSPRR
jgi:GNAT superfamily N-acetyltransferase